MILLLLLLSEKQAVNTVAYRKAHAHRSAVPVFQLFFFFAIPLLIVDEQ